MKKVVNGTAGERSELAGQTAEMVFEAVIGSKGAGAVAKGSMAGAKMALGAERVAEIAESIAKLRQAVKLENLAAKVKGIFKVGELRFVTNAIRKALKTKPNEAFFWSGKTNGIGGEAVALEVATKKGGVTLEGLIKNNDVKMPKWDPADASTIKAWEDVSAVYAEQVSGEVRAVVGKSLRPGNIWENVELPRLKSNPNVTKITTVDPETFEEIVIYTR